MATPDSFLDMLRRNPRGWGNLAPAQEQPPQAIFDEYGQPHHPATGQPLYQNDAPQKSAGDSVHDIAMSPVNMAMAPVHALTSLSELGGFPNPQNPQNQQDVSALVASLFGGNAMRPAAGEAAAMRALADTSGPAFNAIDHPVNLFHGTAGPVDRFNTRDLWASPSERTAAQYADLAAAKTGADKNIIPLELHSDKIMTPAKRWMDENTARQQALDGGYDAINWGPFETGGGDYYQVVRPNTVRHAETGETLFSDTGKPSILGSALAGAEQRNALHLEGGLLKPTPAPNPYSQLALHHFDSLAAMPSTYSHLRDQGLTRLNAARTTLEDTADNMRGNRDMFREDKARTDPTNDLPRFHYDLKDADGNTAGVARGYVDGDTMHLDWLGGTSADKTNLGISGIRALREQARKDFPGVSNFEGERVSGAKDANEARDRTQSIKLLSDTGKPSPLGAALGGSQDDDPSSHAAIMDLLKKYGVTP